jgi:hypothetical protein
LDHVTSIIIRLFLVLGASADAKKGDKAFYFSEIETMLTFFIKARLGSFLIFDQLPCFLYDMRYPDSAGCTKNEEEPNKVITDIPPSGLLPYRPGRARPYLYSNNEVRQLLQAARYEECRWPSSQKTIPPRRIRLDGAEVRRTFYFLSRQIRVAWPYR